jgi:hypothetical protein
MRRAEGDRCELAGLGLLCAVCCLAVLAQPELMSRVNEKCYEKKACSAPLATLSVSWTAAATLASEMGNLAARASVLSRGRGFIDLTVVCGRRTTVAITPNGL